MTEQLEKLANYIMHEVEGEPSSEDGGAGDCAIRLLKEYRERIAELEDAIGGHIVLLNDPESVEAYEAIGLYIQRFFDAEKIEHLIRRIGSQSYVEMNNRIKELEKQSEHWKLQYMGHAESLDFAKMRLEELEEQTKRYTALENPESVEAYAAIGLYIQSHFDAEKRERLFRLCGSQTYVEMSNRIQELEDAQRWIPVSERLPEDIERVLIQYYDGSISIAYHNVSIPMWVTDSGVHYIESYDKIVAWRELPEVSND